MMKSVLEVYDLGKKNQNNVIFLLKMNIPRKYAYLCRKFIN